MFSPPVFSGGHTLDGRPTTMDDELGLLTESPRKCGESYWLVAVTCHHSLFFSIEIVAEFPDHPSRSSLWIASWISVGEEKWTWLALKKVCSAVFVVPLFPVRWKPYRRALLGSVDGWMAWTVITELHVITHVAQPSALGTIGTDTSLSHLPSRMKVENSGNCA